MTTYVQHLKAPNDINGNPRRLYLVTQPHGGDTCTTAYDEGYDGPHAVPMPASQMTTLPSLNVSPAEYNRILRQYPPPSAKTGRRKS